MGSTEQMKDDRVREAQGPSTGAVSRGESEGPSVYEELFDDSVDLLCVARLGGGLEVLNEAWTRVLGWPLEELRGRSWLELLHPTDRPVFAAAEEQQLARGETVRGLEGRWRCRDGGYRWLEWSIHPRPVDGLFYGVGRDITAWRRMEEARLASEEAYRILFAGMLDGFSHHEMIFDDDGRPVDYRFLAVNPAFEQQTGLQAADLVGRTVLEVLPGTEAHWIETYGRVVQTGEPIRFENYSRELGKHFEVLAFRPRPGEFACTFQDITARKEAEAERALMESQLLQAQKLESLGVLAGGIAHDFNNLLGAIVGHAELATLDLPAGHRAQGSLAAILETAARATEICRQMLAFAGSARQESEILDLSSLVRSMAELLEVSVGKKCELRLDLEPGLPAVEVDATQMSQVVLNLIVNASEAIGDRPGVIELRTFSRRSGAPASESAAGEVVLEVVDDGGGMDEEIRARVFDPFFSTKFAGRGLGLAAMRGIVRSHGGTIDVESSPGVGSTFRIALPAATGSVVRAEAAPRSAASIGGGTVLVAEDEPRLRQVVGRMLHRLGFEVLSARDGDEAVALFGAAADRIVLAVLDLTMPKLGGLEALRAIRALRPVLPAVLTSGYDTAAVAEELADQSVGFVSKPFRIADLRAAVTEALADEASRDG